MARKEDYANTTGILSQRVRRGVNFILKPGDGLTMVTPRQTPAATHLISGFNIGVTGNNLEPRDKTGIGWERLSWSR
jgi:hypothetical protein